MSRRKQPTRSSGTTTSTTSSSGAGNYVGSLEYRGKKTVAMPASLYNHFRPVESNIPIEDMSQFLYFGQKIGRGAATGESLSSSFLHFFREIFTFTLFTFGPAGSCAKCGSASRK